MSKNIVDLNINNFDSPWLYFYWMNNIVVPEVMKKLVNGDTLLGLHYNCITCWINESFTMKFAKTHWSSFQLKKQVLYIRSFFKTIGLNKQFSLNKKSLAMSRKVAINKLTGKILVCYFENDFFQSQIYC